MTKKKESAESLPSSSSIEIFEAGTFDLEALSRLFDSYRQFYRQKADEEGARKFLAERMTQKDSVIYLAIDENGTAVGFVQLYPLFSSVGMKKTWLLNDLYVEKSLRGKGISRMLLDRCKELARETGANGLHLETEKINEIGIKLYPSAGFELNTTSNFYFWKCETA
jgi:GNAT superfamily N-acetyltransferase